MLLAMAYFILSTGVGAVLSPDVVPIELDIPGLETLGVEGARQALRSTQVSFCTVSWDLRRTSPSLVPMYRDLVKSSPGCDESSVVRVPWGTLEEEYRSRGCGVGGGGAVPPPPGCVPTGLVFHQSRCGSTLVGNLLASLPDSLGYSEAAPPLELLTSPSLRDLPQDELAAALRVLVAAMGRPAAGDGGGGGGATAHPLFLKLQSTLSLTLPMWRLAFPAVPWAFVHREGVAVLASLLRGSSSPPSPQSLPSVHLSWDDAALTTSPCLRAYAPHGKGGVGEPHASLLGGSDPVASRLSPEEACAAHAALLAASALSSAMAARTQGFARLSPPLVLVTPGEGSSLLALPPHSGVSVVGGSEGLVVVGGGGEEGGVVGGIGQGIMVDYSTLPDFALTVIQGHFGFKLSPTTRGALMGEAKLYSKARGATGGKEGGSGKGGHQQQQRVGLGEGGVYVEDTEAKSAIAWPALESAAAKYMANLHTALKAFNPTASALQGGGGALGLDGAGQPVVGGVDGGAVSVNPSATASLLPLGGGYPALFPLSEMLRVWNPDITLPPPSYGSFSSLRVFNFSSPSSLAEALKYRRAELPFLMRGIPSLDATVKAWGEDKYLEGLMGGDELVYPCEVSSGQHFMYFNKAKAGKMRGYVPPTSEGHLSITKWLARAHESLNITRGEERRVLGLGEGGLGGEEEGIIGDFLLQQQALPPRPTQPLPPQPTIARTPREMHYLRASTNQRDKSANAWVWDALAFLRSDEDSPYGRASAPDVTTPTATALEWPFFLVDASNQRGIHCRFGMGGIIAESHSDAGRNFITMERGHKRYILSPPEECSRLSILSDGPSARHSSLDWSSLEGIGALGAAGALATEVILAPGDALYVPAGWFHFIMSLDTNVQCNTRSGTPPLHEDILGACGIAPPVTENMGDFIDPQAPALQPFREAHGKLWGSKWPLPLQSGAIPLPEAYKDALPLNPPTLVREPLPPPPPPSTTTGGGGIPLGRFLEAFPHSSALPPTTTPAISTVAPITPPAQNHLVPPIPVMLPKSAKGPLPLTPPIKPATVMPIKALDTTASTTTTTTTASQGGQAPPAPLAPTTGDSFTAAAAPKTDQKGVVVEAEPFNPVSTTTSSTPSTPTIVTPPTPPPSDTPPSSLFTPLNLIVIMVFAGVVVGGATAYVGRSKSSGGGVWETLNTSTLSASERAKQLMARGKGLRASISAILPNTSSWRKRVYQESQSPLPLAADLVRVKGSDGIV